MCSQCVLQWKYKASNNWVLSNSKKMKHLNINFNELGKGHANWKNRIRFW